jgi:hypothetical protein
MKPNTVRQYSEGVNKCETSFYERGQEKLKNILHNTQDWQTGEVIYKHLLSSSLLTQGYVSVIIDV